MMHMYVVDHTDYHNNHDEEMTYEEIIKMIYYVEEDEINKYPGEEGSTCYQQLTLMSLYLHYFVPELFILKGSFNSDTHVEDGGFEFDDEVMDPWDVSIDAMVRTIYLVCVSLSL